MFFQRLVIAVADGQTFVVPDLPAGFVQRFDDLKDLVPVPVGIADEDEGLLLIRRLLVNAIAALGDFARQHKDVPTLAYTHYQAAQPTTVGKRACLWLQDLVMDLDRLEYELGQLKLLGCKGTTGTGASFLELFGGDAEKVYALEDKIAEKMGFESCMPVSGQTYSRKVDAYVLNVLADIAASMHKMATDLRLMAHMKEFDVSVYSDDVLLASATGHSKKDAEQKGAEKGLKEYMRLYPEGC